VRGKPNEADIRHKLGREMCMDRVLREDILSILENATDMTIATIRQDGYPQATTVSYVNDGLTNIFRLCSQISEGQEYHLQQQGLAHG
jgi:nitroimidazol reductase NimA-like FMN-containing flavoprotein (pyridoxamine 5'-phosphate oxidase superfamily)